MADILASFTNAQTCKLIQETLDILVLPHIVDDHSTTAVIALAGATDNRYRLHQPAPQNNQAHPNSRSYLSCVIS